MPQDLMELLYLLAFSLIVATVIIIPVLLWRSLKGQPLLDLKKRKKFESPKTFYIGIIFFGFCTLWAFYENSSYHAIFLLIIVVLYIVGLIAYKKGWRG